LQIAPVPSSADEELNRYSEEATGRPLYFSVGGTHGTKYPLWIFPDPKRHLDLDENTFLKVRRRFELVREDLQKELLNQVRELLPQLEKPDPASDSSGMSDESDENEQKEDPDWLSVYNLEQRRRLQSGKT
jgi:hypothetical protein